MAVVATAAGTVVAAALLSQAAPALPKAARPPEQAPAAPEVAASREHSIVTTIDLSDDWVPAPFVDEPILGDTGEVEYGETLIALANEELGEGRTWRRAKRDRYFEIYGIFPSLAVVRGRLLDEARHRCHDRVNPLHLLPALGEDGKKAPPANATRAAQRHLVCDGFLAKRDVGRAKARTKRALKLYQKMHMLLPTGRLDADTAGAMLLGSRELDFRTLLRVLRERTVDATGLIEDGSAAGVHGKVLDRELDAPEFRHFDEALPKGAPDAISPATEAAARSIGWTSPAAAAAWFRERSADATRSLTVDVVLPPPPAYHAAVMELRAEIDRADGQREDGKPARRPSLVLYAVTPDGDVPLIRWPTTVGGWQNELTPEGAVERRFKASPLGPRVWRKVVAGPAWFPPETTPPDELVSSWGTIQQDSIGPGYASAYGLVMLMHEQVIERAKGDVFRDGGIRTHGSVNVSSITRGNSHGCHRLFNHLAVRLTTFLLRHRLYLRRGPIATNYVLEVPWEMETLRLRRKGRGYLWELTPPVPVEVIANRSKDDP